MAIQSRPSVLAMQLLKITVVSSWEVQDPPEELRYIHRKSAVIVINRLYRDFEHVCSPDRRKECELGLRQFIRQSTYGRIQ